MAEDYYRNLSKGIARPSQDVVLASEKQVEEASTTDVLGAAASSAFVGSSVVRAFNRRSAQFATDETWEVDEDMEKALMSEYAPDDIQKLKMSRSQEEFVSIKADLAEDDERDRMMMSKGWVGMAARVGFELVDPAAWTLSAATGGLSWLRKGNAFVRAAKLGTTVGLENVAIDSMLMSGDTNSEASDLIMSFGAGAVIGGGLGALSKRSDIVKEADSADQAASIDSENYIIKKAVLDNLPPEQRPIRKSFPDSDARAVQADMDRFEAQLRADASDRVSRTDALSAKRGIGDLEEEIALRRTNLDNAISELQQEADDVIAGIRSPEAALAKKRAVQSQMKGRVDALKAEVSRLERGAGKSTATNRDVQAMLKADDKLSELGRRIDEIVGTEIRNLDIKSNNVKRTLAKRVSKLEQQYTKAAKDLQDKIKPLQETLDRVPKARNAAKTMREWNRMSLEDKVKFLYGEAGPPSRIDQLNAQTVTAEDAKVIYKDKDELKGKTGSVGAAEKGFTETSFNEPYSVSEKSAERINRLMAEGIDGAEEVRGAMLPMRSKITDAIHSAQNMISNSKDYAIRGFGYLMFEAPQGGKAGKATASIRKVMYDNQIRGAMKNRLNEGLYEFGQEKKLSKWKSLMDKEHIDDFNKRVMIEVKRPGSFNSPAIVKAAAGTRDQLLTAGSIRKEAGEAGFENVDLNKNYVPVVMDNNAIKSALVGGRHPQSRVRGVLSRAYQKGDFKLDPATADRLADAQIKRALDDTLVTSEQVRGVTNKDMEELKKGLEKAGVDDDVIESIMNDSMEKEIRQHMSNRAKKSMRPRIDVEYEGLRFIDLIDNDLPKILESYTRDAAGGAAFAKMGYSTRSQVLDQLNDLEIHATQKTNMSPAQIEREINTLRDGVDMIYGRTLNTDNRSLVKGFSRARTAAGLLRLQFVGAASIPELARITSQRSISSVLESVKDLGAIRGTKHLREGGKYSGSFKRQDLDELDQVITYAGEDNVLYANGLRADDIEESEYVSRIGAYFDRATAQGRRLQEVASGFRLIQGTGERLAVRSLALDIKKMIAGTGKPLSESNINRAGWSDGFLDELSAWMRANPKTAMHGDKEITLFNFGKMPPDMQERLQVGMHRLVRADMQRPNIGETPMFMNKWLGQTITQFRSFSILSMEKQLVHDYRHDKAMGALIAMQSAMYGVIGVGVASLQRNIGREDADERIKRDMSGNNLLAGVMSRMGQTAALGIGADMLATVGLMPDSMMQDRDQVGARAMTSDSVPVFGLVKDAVEVPKSVTEALKGDGTTSKVIKDMQDVVPFGKTIGVNQAINVIRGSLDN